MHVYLLEVEGILVSRVHMVQMFVQVTDWRFGGERLHLALGRRRTMSLR